MYESFRFNTSYANENSCIVFEDSWNDDSLEIYYRISSEDIENRFDDRQTIKKTDAIKLARAILEHYEII